MIQVNLSPLFLDNLQLTGTSGSSLADQNMIMQKTLAGKLNPNRSVAAIGGIEAAVDGLNAMMRGEYAGKILIFPQINNLPLIGLDELHDKYPQIAEALGENNPMDSRSGKGHDQRFLEGVDNEQDKKRNSLEIN